MKKENPVTVSPEEGETLSVVGDTYRILVSGKQTGGEFATMEFNVPPGGGPGPHSHAAFHESFYVVEGEVEVNSEAGTFVAKKGAFVTIPKGGIVHDFKNKTSENAVLICTVVPAGLEEFFEAVGKPVAVGEFLPLPDMSDPEVIQQMDKMAAKYGQKVYPPDYLG